MNIPASLSTYQYAYLQKTFTSWFNVAEGGIRGGKNVLNTLAFALNLERHPERIHLVAGVDIAAAKINIFDCDGYGLLNYFEGRCREGLFKNRDALFVKTVTGAEKIVIPIGLGKESNEKKTKGITAGMVYITEANECTFSGVKEMFHRTARSRNRKVFHDLNPKAEGHFYYKDVLEFHEKKQESDPGYGYNYGHFNLFDNLSMTQDEVNKVVETYDQSSAWYKRDVLGARMSLEGLIYPMFNRDYHVVKTVARPYSKYWVSVDYGTQNATSMGLWGMAYCSEEKKDVYYRIAEYYHSGRETNEQYTTGGYYAEMEKLIGGKKIEAVIVDPAATHYIAEIKQHRKYFVRNAKNAILRGIAYTANALDGGHIKYNDCCAHAIRDMGLYSWKSKGVDDEPAKTNDHGHAADEIRYFAYTIGILDEGSRFIR